jgi:hypothetical protein
MVIIINHACIPTLNKYARNYATQHAAAATRVAIVASVS